MLTVERLKQLLHYDPETGVWTRIKSAGRYPVGSIVGCVQKHGYHTIKVDKKLYLAHRLVYFYMCGEWPQSEIDHRDLDKTNNKWSNLRCSTRPLNLANQAVRKTNKLGIKGVHEVRGRFRALHKNKHLGYFRTVEEASAAYAKAATAYAKDFARNG